MASDPSGPPEGEPTGDGPAENPQSEQARPVARGSNTYAFAADRHLDDLKAQRDRLEAMCAKTGQELEARSGRIAGLSAENARLVEVCRGLTKDLESERLQRSILGISGTVMAALGGGLVSVFTGWPQFVFGAFLLSGCLLLLYNVILNFSAAAARDTPSPQQSSP